jgi:hypothetical protein
MSAHTPGPWRAIPPEEQGSHFRSWIVGRGTATLVSVMNASGATAYNEADARLIAAAPDLLMALEDAVHLFEQCQPYLADARVSSLPVRISLDAARAAIAKARGGAA